MVSQPWKLDQIEREQAMTSSRKSSNLLAHVLDRQIEPEQEFDDLWFVDAVSDHLHGDAALPDEVVRLIWTSPSARSLYQRMRAELAREATQKWRRHGHALEFERRAADSLQDSDRFSASGVTIRLLYSQATERWMISLQLSREAYEDLPPGLNVRVTDGGGMVWLEGALDRHGGLDGSWTSDESPQDRLRDHPLSIDFF
ncbi:MAG: hypothetical protein AB1729_05395 [Pseudomonadota bacterium]|nr:hypothetical protein [Blastomonas sp.]